MNINLSLEELKEVLGKAYQSGCSYYHDCMEDCVNQIMEDLFENKKEKINIVYSDKENVRFNFEPKSSEILVCSNENLTEGYYNYCMPYMHTGSSYSYSTTTTSNLLSGYANQIEENSENTTLIN